MPNCPCVFFSATEDGCYALVYRQPRVNIELLYITSNKKHFTTQTVLKPTLFFSYKDESVPIVVVANKSDLALDPELPHDSLEATVIFDWENGYVESSAKERRNINKIFKELLQQAKARYDFSLPQLNMANALINAPSASSSANPGTPRMQRTQVRAIIKYAMESCLLIGILN